jgi:hypothetical protein
MGAVTVMKTLRTYKVARRDNRKTAGMTDVVIHRERLRPPKASKLNH